jgi:hypothetical protein
MAAWIQAWSKCHPAVPVLARRKGEQSDDTLQIDIRPEIVDLLANMALSGLQEAGL